MKQFAKLYETGIGQIVVMRQGIPRITFFFGADFCIGRTSLDFSNDAAADAVFDSFDETSAIKLAHRLNKEFKEAA